MAQEVRPIDKAVDLLALEWGTEAPTFQYEAEIVFGSISLPDLAEVIRNHRRNRLNRRDYTCVCGKPLESNSHYVQSAHIAEEIVEWLLS